MTRRDDPSLSVADLSSVASLCRTALSPALAADWTGRAGDLDWTCRRTLDHVVDALFFYAVMLATRAIARPVPARDGDPAKSPAELLVIVESAAAILGEVARAAPAGTRAFHPAGMTDPEGFLALGCEEILIHTDDIAVGLGCSFAPPPALAGRVLRRLFPWAPAGHDPWPTLKWACGRAALPGHARLDADWYWHSAPLAEWDGRIKRRAAPPHWS